MEEFKLNINVPLVFKYTPLEKHLKEIALQMLEEKQPVVILSDICPPSANQFIENFKKAIVENTIGKPYNLINYCDEMLAILLLSYRHEFDLLTNREHNIQKEKLAKNLTKLLFNLNEEILDGVNFKFKNPSKSIKIDDSDVTEWLRSLIIDAIERKNYPIGLFGFTFFNATSEDLNNNHELLDFKKIKGLIKKPILNTEKMINQAIANACLNVKLFLDNETSMISKGGYNYSDDQGTLFYDILKDVMKIDISTTDFPFKDYTKADFIRSRLTNGFSYRLRKTKIKEPAK